jgi:hypothetical protein
MSISFEEKVASINHQARSLNQSQVGRNWVANSQFDHVANHYLGNRNSTLDPVKKGIV